MKKKLKDLYNRLAIVVIVIIAGVLARILPMSLCVKLYNKFK